jgi:predicted GH43/DUF377 family glycosyl hydrolase
MTSTDDRTPLQEGPAEMFVRHPANPIITAADLPRMVNAVFNPGATVFDGETLLLLRVEDRTGLSHLVVARSPNGYDNWIVERDRGMFAQTSTFEEHWGIEDPRITRVGDEYLIVYTGYSATGAIVLLASTRDFVNFERRGVLQPPEDKDAALFPTTFDGRWALIHRPTAEMAGVGAHIWLSWSPDLRHFGDAKVLLPARRGGWWDANKVGLGPPPMLTHVGWLVCYHGVRVTASGSIYRLGLALLEREDPTRLVARSNEWVFGPSTHYERTGDVPDVVFPCGWILDDDGDTIRMYYGAADSVVCLATASLKALLDHVMTHPYTDVNSSRPPNLVHRADGGHH